MPSPTVVTAATWEDEERITYHENTSWRSEVDHFLSAVIDGDPVRIGNSSDALELMRTIDNIYEKGRAHG